MVGQARQDSMPIMAGPDWSELVLREELQMIISALAYCNGRAREEVSRWRGGCGGKLGIEAAR